MDPRLAKIASELQPVTLLAARSALKTAGLKKGLALELFKEACRLEEYRKEVAFDRISRHLGYSPVDAQKLRALFTSPGRGWSGGIWPRWPEHGTPTVDKNPAHAGAVGMRLDELRRKVVLTTLRRLISPRARGTWRCVLTDDPSTVGVHTRRYAVATADGNAMATDTILTVPRDWRKRVQRRGLALVDGLMTLDAVLLQAGTWEVFAATWLRKAGNKTVVAEKGFIARFKGSTQHGATFESAMTGLEQQIRTLEDGHQHLRSLEELLKMIARNNNFRAQGGENRS